MRVLERLDELYAIGDGEGANRSLQIHRLHDELQRAVEREEFEHAAGIRDEIKRLESGTPSAPPAGEKPQ